MLDSGFLARLVVLRLVVPVRWVCYLSPAFTRYEIEIVIGLCLGKGQAKISTPSMIFSW